MADYCSSAELLPLPDNPAEEIIAEFERIRENKGNIKAHELRNRMQTTMTDNVSVFRIQEQMENAVSDMDEIKNDYIRFISVDDKGKLFNTDLLEAWELGCLIDLARVTAASALARTESRGAHARDDFQDRDDENWLTHTMALVQDDGSFKLTYKPVTLGRYVPKPRVY
jgi:succinate dehydrogenase / fumarate reductase flavoprotein subunit